jgi:hypothetical protein
MPAPLHPTYPTASVNSPRPRHTSSQPSQIQLESGDQLLRSSLPRPALLRGGIREKEPKKHVRFASEIPSNEDKSKSRPKSNSGAKKLLRSPSKFVRVEASNPSLKAVAANTSAKKILPPAISLPRPEYSHHEFDHHRERSPHGPGDYSKKALSPRKPALILPPVPDAPKTLIPPPAPRPARSATPDLPEVDGEMMFGPLPAIKKSFFAIHDPRPKIAHQKMNVQSK